MQTVTGRSARLIGKAGGTPVNEFLLVRFGYVEVDRVLSGGDFTFTRAHALAAVQWFDQQRRKLVIDYEHQTLGSSNRPDGLAPAAGWVGRLEVRADGLWAAGVEWTEQARTLLARGEYVYFSPVIYWADKDCTDLASLGPVALTNDPAMAGAQRLAAKKGSGHMTTILQACPLNGDDDGGGSGIAAIMGALREALSELMGALDNADAATRGAIADELTEKDYELLDAAGTALWELREMTATAAGRRSAISSPGGASLSKRGGGFVAARTADRRSIILAAKRAFVKEQARTAVMCSEAAWVNLALRDTAKPKLSDNELTMYGLTS